jgi:hypothetical protein
MGSTKIKFNNEEIFRVTDLLRSSILSVSGDLKQLLRFFGEQTSLGRVFLRA